MKKLLELKRNDTGNATDTIASWDMAYYADKQKKQFKVDEEKIKEYFPVLHVVN